MRSVIRIIKNFFFVIFAALIGSIVFSLILVLGATSIYQSPLVTVLVTLLFTPFHFSDYQRFVRYREWSLIALRFILIAAISSFLVGLFRAALGYMMVDWYLPALFMFTAPIIFGLIGTYLFFAFFFPNNSAFVRVNGWWSGLVRGGKVYGIWWNY